jgi:hypothetical protein
MIAIGCDDLMGHYSELGPVDPQLSISTPEGGRQGPARAVLQDFKRAQQETSQNVAMLSTPRSASSCTSTSRSWVALAGRKADPQRREEPQ